jgi:hypothetical protein
MERDLIFLKPVINFWKAFLILLKNVKTSGRLFLRLKNVSKLPPKMCSSKSKACAYSTDGQTER